MLCADVIISRRAQDPLYTQLLEVAASPNNVAFRASAAYYEQMEKPNDTL